MTEQFVFITPPQEHVVRRLMLEVVERRKRLRQAEQWLSSFRLWLPGMTPPLTWPQGIGPAPLDELGRPDMHAARRRLAEVVAERAAELDAVSAEAAKRGCLPR